MTFFSRAFYFKFSCYLLFFYFIKKLKTLKKNNIIYIFRFMLIKIQVHELIFVLMIYDIEIQDLNTQ